ncbi:MAG: radical SAM protein [Proteobacteria bacterium]|nr:radical SAM protein [Pseudomonadota bacterium]MCP4915972.1 radical SAM protein [Pseudomonadota bacterium]
MARKPSLAEELYTDANSSVDALFLRQMRENDAEPVDVSASAKPSMALVVGPSPFSMPRGWEFFLTSPYEGVTYISTVLNNAGYPVTIIDVRYSPDPLKEAYDAVVAGGFDTIGLATFEDNFPWCVEFTNEVKAALPKTPMILGGSLVTSVPETFFANCRVDVAVISEGEITILEVMDSYARGAWDRELASIRGIAFRGPNNEMLRTVPRGQMMDLDSLPKMRLDLWPQFKDPRGLQPEIIASYSRGCKMDCSFCYRTTPQVRAKSPEKLSTELAWLKEQYGTEFIFFVDLTFTSYKRQTLEICEAIQDHDIRWTCLTRCGDVEKERLDAMKKAGCDIVLYGVESLGKNILKEARKGNSNNITIKSMHATYEADLRFGALIIVGLPGEDEQSLEDVCTWAEENNHITRVKYLSAMPGTTVYSQGLRDGIIKSEVDHLNWLSIEQALHEDEFLNYNGLSEDIIRRSYKRVYDSYQPGPVMDFKHWPEHFIYHGGNPDDGKAHSVEYAGEGWRKDFASGLPHLAPGSERFTLDATGTPEMAAVGSKTMDCGAKQLGAAAK